jgi:predicted HTH transcriptional regulator
MPGRSRYDRVVAYTPIVEDLPEPGPLPEGLRFDMKMELKEQIDKKPIEQQVEDLACDVAAFANTAGGVLLIGAHEHPKDSGILHTYKPITQPDAMLVFEALKKASDLCSPKPIADARPIPLRNGSGFVVAINCDPYAAPPIGVAKSGQGGGEKWWAFPARRGRHNRPPGQRSLQRSWNLDFGEFCCC